MTYQEFTEKVLNGIRESEEFIISDEANPTQPVFNIGKISEFQKDHAIYAIKFFPTQEVCLIWNYKRHRNKHKECGAALSDLNVGTGWDGIVTGSDVFYPVYKYLGTKKGHDGLRLYEKVYVVGISYLNLFFSQYHAFMEMNNQDDDFPKGAVDDGVWRSDSERKKYSSSQYCREKQFRDAVLTAYDHQCAICRCNIDIVLQAAHERGYEVMNTKYDDPMHGICLCANHHLMYDQKLIDIDLHTLTITIKEEKIKDMPWYQEFIVKYHGKILERNDNS